MSENNQEAQQEYTVTDDLDAFTNEFFGQSQPEPDEPASSEDEGSEAEQEDVEASEEESQEQEDQDDTEEVEAEAEVVEQPPKKKTVQDRIDELVRQREDAKREGQVALDALRKEFEEKLAAIQKEPDQRKPIKETTEPTPDDTNEDGTPKYDLGEFDPQYIRDLTRYTLEQERNQAAAQAAEEAQANQARQAQEMLTQAWNEKVEAAKVEYPDFVEKGQELLSGFQNLDEGYAGYLSTLLMSMDKGPEVLYYLSNNPAEAATIVNSGAQKATLALGRIEAKFLEVDAKKVLAKPKVSKAPNPPPPQARARGSNGAFISVAPDTDDLDAFSSEFFAKRK